MRKINRIVYKELGYQINRALYFHNALKKLLFKASADRFDETPDKQQKYFYLGIYFYKVYVHETPEGFVATPELNLDWKEFVNVYRNSFEGLSHIIKRRMGEDNIEDLIYCITHPEIEKRKFSLGVELELERRVFECPKEPLDKLKEITREVRREAALEAREYYKKYNKYQKKVQS